MVAGKELTYAEAQQELRSLQTELHDLFNFTNFALVTDDDWGQDAMKLNRLAMSVGTLPTPCGIDNFKGGQR